MASLREPSRFFVATNLRQNVSGSFSDYDQISPTLSSAVGVPEGSLKFYHFVVF
jgi:hypothetical protein